jgi:hypothetical protein
VARPRRRALAHGGLVALAALASVAANTDPDAPPRFDGAGYAVLAESLRTGRGYREIDQPDAPRHAHFPPGYPATLAALWAATGPSERAAHALSAGCVVAAAVLGWAWLRGLYRPRAALALGLALAVNWTWGRAGGSIQSEPLYLLLAMLALHAARWAARGGAAGGLASGLVLGAATLTRHVGLTLALAVGIDLALRRRWAALAACGLATSASLAPWLAWLGLVRHHTQVGLLPTTGLPALVASQALFYARRLPDSLVGPGVEVATVFRPALRWPATLAALAGTSVLALGWLRALRSRRRRLAGLVPLATLPLLLVWPFTEAGRFLVPLVPFALAGAFEGLRLGVSRTSARRRALAWAAWLLMAASIPYPLYSALARRPEAARAAQADFDAACRWVARQADRPGPVLTRQPGEAYWLMGRSRNALAPPEAGDPDAIDALIDDRSVAFLIVDDDRYANAPASPLGRFARARPGRVREVWRRGAVAVEAVVRPAGARAGDGPGP